MQYFGSHLILDKGSTVAHCKNDQLEIIGLAVIASLFFQRKILVNWVAKVYYIECALA